MKVLQVYNQYRSLFNGEENVVFQTDELLKKYGHDAHLLMRTSRGIEKRFATKARAFFSGIYSPSARDEMTEVLTRERPDIVHVHNLYPLFSPSVLVACRRQRTPVVMSLHNQNLTCPKADHLHRGKVCERCTGAGGEIHCVLRNCRGNIAESVGYAVRSSVARHFRLFHDNITRFIALTQFAKNRLVNNGFDARQIEVLPNMVRVDRPPSDASMGGRILFAGRLSSEKGIPTLLEAARTTGCPIELAGDGPQRVEYQQGAPANAIFHGQLDRSQMRDLYRQARALVLPSQCFEMCPLVIMEAMSHGVPVIASRIGGLGELVDDERTGLLFEPGNAADLAAKIMRLWSDPSLAKQFGLAGYEKARRLYSENAHHRSLIGIYERAIVEVGGVDAVPAAPNRIVELEEGAVTE